MQAVGKGKIYIPAPPRLGSSGQECEKTIMVLVAKNNPFAKRRFKLPRNRTKYEYVKSGPVMGVDPWGTNRIVVIGGIADCPEKEFDDHDKNWKNFVAAAELRVNEDKKQLRKGEVIEWLVNKQPYIDRGKKDKAKGIVKNKMAYINKIIRIAKKHDVKLRWFDTKEEFVRLINYSPNSRSPRSNDFKTVVATRERQRVVSLDPIARIQRIDYLTRIGQALQVVDDLKLISTLHVYSHGQASVLTFDLFTTNKIRFGIDDISKLDKGAFNLNAKCVSWACNTATQLVDKRTFTGEWAKHIREPMKGVIGKTDYGPTAVVSTAAKVEATVNLFVADELPLFHGVEMVDRAEKTLTNKGPSGPVLSEGAKWSEE